MGSLVAFFVFYGGDFCIHVYVVAPVGLLIYSRFLPIKKKCSRMTMDKQKQLLTFCERV